MEPGGVIEREAPIHLSNVALRDPQDKKPTRVKTIEEDGKRMRASARTGAKF
jgi:large subunit ribosomal protein L24